jgi:lipoprotein-releasing system ATP-binding protein
MTTVLEARRLTRTLGDAVKQEILHGIDLQIDRGQFVAVTGHSGSGKSTLLYLLGALDKPTSGEVHIAGTDAGALDEDGRCRLRNEKLGFVFQFHFLLPEFSAAENVMIPMLRQGLPPQEARERADRALRDVGIPELADRRPHKMSGGQQQRVAIARAVAHRPEIVLADEPTGNLDSQNGELVVELFERLNREQGITIVMVTHDPDFALRASRQVALKDGRIVSDELRS